MFSNRIVFILFLKDPNTNYTQLGLISLLMYSMTVAMLYTLDENTMISYTSQIIYID